MHAGIAEVAAAKARMFINKPDGSMLFDLFETLSWKILYSCFFGADWRCTDFSLFIIICYILFNTFFVQWLENREVHILIHNILTFMKKRMCGWHLASLTSFMK